VATINATTIPTSEINTSVRRHMNVRDAARRLGVSESAIRRVARDLGVTRFAGSTVAGGLLIDASPVPIVIAYSKGPK